MSVNQLETELRAVQTTIAYLKDRYDVNNDKELQQHIKALENERDSILRSLKVKKQLDHPIYETGEFDNE